MNEEVKLKPVLWICSSKRDLMKMPSDVIDDFGFGLYQAQIGKYPDTGRTLTGFGNANIIELVVDHKGDTFRTVYTMRFIEIIVVLHAFQKKSKRGICTPKPDIDLIRSRLKMAETIYKELKKKEAKMTKNKEKDHEVTTNNIFAALDRETSDELLARAQLLDQVSSLIKRSGLSQKEVAKKLGITQPKVSMLVGGRLSAFSTDILLHYLSILGCEVQIRVKKPRSRIGIFRHKGCIAVY